MRTVLFPFIATVLTITTTYAAQIADPVADFLHRTDKAVYRPSFPTFHLDDQVYRFDVDLNQDRSNEVLVSSSLDRDGKQGNVFYVYRAAGDGFESIGQIHLSPNGFYLGKIDELNRYGIVTFLPSGGGTGAYIAYLFDGRIISETPLGSIDRNPETGKIEGKGIELAAKYSDTPSEAIRQQVEQFRASSGIKPPESSTFVTQPQKTSAAELAQKYKIKVEGTTVEQALRERLSSTPPKIAQATTPHPPSRTSPSYSVASPSAESSEASALPANVSERVPRSMLFWIGGIGVVAVIGVLIWK